MVFEMLLKAVGGGLWGPRGVGRHPMQAGRAPPQVCATGNPHLKAELVCWGPLELTFFIRGPQETP